MIPESSPTEREVIAALVEAAEVMLHSITLPLTKREAAAYEMLERATDLAYETGYTRRKPR